MLCESNFDIVDASHFRSAVKDLIGQKALSTLDEAGLVIIPRFVIRSHKKKNEVLANVVTAMAERLSVCEEH